MSSPCPQPGRALGCPLRMGCRPPGEPLPSVPAFLVQTVYPLFPSCSSAVAVICSHQQAFAFHTTLGQGAKDLKTFGFCDTNMDTGALSSHCPPGFWGEGGRGRVIPELAQVSCVVTGAPGRNLGLYPVAPAVPPRQTPGTCCTGGPGSSVVTG